MIWSFTSSHPTVWEKRRQQRVQNARDVVRHMLFGDEDEDQVLGEEDEEEEEDQVGPTRRRRRYRFIDDECTLSRGPDDDDKSPQSPSTHTKFGFTLFII